MVESQIVLQFQLRNGRSVGTVVFLVRGKGFPVGLGKGIVLVGILTVSLIANFRSIGVGPGWRRSQRLFKVKRVCVRLLQHLGSGLRIVAGSSLGR